MPTPSAGGHTILVVDDNADLRDLVADSLRKLGGFLVTTAANGIEGLQRYFELHPDCVVIDVKMPGLDGHQLIRALRGDPDSQHTPLVILSAMVQDRDRLAGFLSGADAYLVKPVSPLELVKTVTSVMSQSEEDRQRRTRALLDESSGPPQE